MTIAAIVLNMKPKKSGFRLQCIDRVRVFSCFLRRRPHGEDTKPTKSCVVHVNYFDFAVVSRGRIENPFANYVSRRRNRSIDNGYNYPKCAHVDLRIRSARMVRPINVEGGVCSFAWIERNAGKSYADSCKTDPLPPPYPLS